MLLMTRVSIYYRLTVMGVLRYTLKVSIFFRNFEANGIVWKTK